MSLTHAGGDGWLDVWQSCIDTNGDSLSGAGFTGQNNITSDPQFFSTSNFRLSAGSPCLKCGTLAYLPCVDTADLDKDGTGSETLPKDFDLNARQYCPLDPCDRGAYERQLCPLH